MTSTCVWCHNASNEPRWFYCPSRLLLLSRSYYVEISSLLDLHRAETRFHITTGDRCTTTSIILMIPKINKACPKRETDRFRHPTNLSRSSCQIHTYNICISNLNDPRTCSVAASEAFLSSYPTRANSSPTLRTRRPALKNKQRDLVRK